MTATKRERAAYRAQLAKIDDPTKLTAPCIGAVITVYTNSACTKLAEGTLMAYTHRTGIGLLGARLITDVEVCTACAHKTGDCSPDTLVRYTDVVMYDIVRNGDRKPRKS